MSLVEAALMLPLLFLLLFGMLEYGWAFLKAQEVNNAARHGARIGAADAATAAEVRAGVAALMADAGLSGSGYVVTLEPADPTTLAPGELLTVRVELDYANIELIQAPFIPVPDQLRARTSMAREGPAE